MREVRGGERRDGGSCVPRKEKAESEEAGNKDLACYLTWLCALISAETRAAFSVICTDILSICQTRMLQVFIQRNSAM